MTSIRSRAIGAVSGTLPCKSYCCPGMRLSSHGGRRPAPAPDIHRDVERAQRPRGTQEHPSLIHLLSTDVGGYCSRRAIPMPQATRTPGAQAPWKTPHAALRAPLRGTLVLCAAMTLSQSAGTLYQNEPADTIGSRDYAGALRG